MISVILMDPNPIYTAGIETILGKVDDILIVCETQEETRIIKIINQFHPQLLLIDQNSLLKIDKWQTYLTSFSKANIRTIVIHAINLEVYLFDFIQSGILGALVNNISEEYLIQAIRKAAMGEILFSQDQIDQARIWKDRMTEKWTQLIDRERYILNLLDIGLSNKEIALSLEITTKTVSFHISNIFSKLGVNSRQEAANWVTQYLGKTQYFFLEGY